MAITASSSSVVQQCNVIRVCNIEMKHNGSNCKKTSLATGAVGSYISWLLVRQVEDQPGWLQRAQVSYTCAKTTLELLRWPYGGHIRTANMA
ncbi:hypothetical protein AB6A40_003859 [Gnathostoma spinigerum]|uniref:Uncharacterized protein n=1 Tax=Gnathostoma spinigerum TaxID=75299 RepID=A0ABD6EAT0_9BILA